MLPSGKSKFPALAPYRQRAVHLVEQEPSASGVGANSAEAAPPELRKHQASPTGLSFQITASSIECTGPGPSLPPSPFSGCVLLLGGDTGIPPVTGHYSLNPFAGHKINIQVNQLP